MDYSYLIQNFLYFFLLAVIYYSVKLIKKRITKEQLEIIEILALRAVQYAEQKFRTGEKFEEAASFLVNEAKKRGIVLSNKEVEATLEATLRSLKDKYGEQWGKTQENQ